MEFKISKKCDVCEGSGFISGSVCPKCHGTGIIESAPKLHIMLEKNAEAPVRATKGSVGYDLFTKKDQEVLWILEKPQAIRTGVHIALPEGFAGIIKARSGFARDFGMQIYGGVIDWDYRGEIIVIASAFKPLSLRKRERFAQLLILPMLSIDPIFVKELPETERGSGGFGSTGI